MNRVSNNIDTTETLMFPRVKFDPESQRSDTRWKEKTGTIFSLLTLLSSLPKGKWLPPMEREEIEKPSDHFFFHFLFLYLRSVHIFHNYF